MSKALGMTVLPDVLEENLKVVFCGTAAGTRSAQIGAYYAGRGNKFWPVLYRVGLTPYQLEPTQFQDVIQFGIGLTDLAQNTSGMDKVLKNTDFAAEAFRERIRRYAPKVVAFNGKKGASVFFGKGVRQYGLQTEMIGATAIFILPSTSGAANRFWDEAIWQKLADYAFR